jgi:hypothetical protein
MQQIAVHQGLVGQGRLHFGLAPGLICFRFDGLADRLHIDDDLEDFSGKRVVVLLVVACDRGGVILSNTRGLVEREENPRKDCDRRSIQN